MYAKRNMYIYFININIINKARLNVRMCDYAPWWTYIKQKNKYKIFNKIFNNIKKKIRIKQKIQPKKKTNKKTKKQTKKPQTEIYNEIIEWSKSLFSKPGSGARGFEEPSGEHVVTVRYMHIGNSQN